MMRDAMLNYLKDNKILSAPNDKRILLKWKNYSISYLYFYS
jgi:hypothetical protein